MVLRILYLSSFSFITFFENFQTLVVFTYIVHIYSNIWTAELKNHIFINIFQSRNGTQFWKKAEPISLNFLHSNSITQTGIWVFLKARPSLAAIYANVSALSHSVATRDLSTKVLAFAVNVHLWNKSKSNNNRFYQWLKWTFIPRDSTFRWTFSSFCVLLLRIQVLIFFLVLFSLRSRLCAIIFYREHFPGLCVIVYGRWYYPLMCVQKS